MKTNRIILGDAEDTVASLDNGTIDVLISDIPYGVSINPNWDKDIPNESLWKECYRVLKPGSYCIIFGQPSMLMELMSIMSNTDFEYKDMWIWKYQGTHTKGIKLEEEGKIFRSKIRNVYNPIYVFRKKIEGKEIDNWRKYRTNLLNIDTVRELYEGNHSSIQKKFNLTGEKHKQSNTISNTFSTMKQKGWVPNINGREPTNVKYFSRPTKKERTINGLVENSHETVKPLKLMMWLVNLITNNSSQVVLDPFCGSGTTCCACKLLNRQYIGVDNDLSSVEIAKKRVDNIKELTNMFGDLDI